MNKTNDVFQVLVPVGTAQTAGVAVSALTANQWGVFDYETNLSITSTVAANYPEKFYIAQFVNGNLRKSAAFYIPLSEIWALSGSAGGVATAGVLTLSALGDVANDGVYTIKIEFRGNSELYQRFGYNAATKFFVADTSCEPVSPATEALAQFYEAVANDPDNFMDVQVTGTLPVALYDASAQEPGELTATQIANLVSLRAGTWTDEALVITVNTFSEMYSFCSINPKYFHMRQVQVIPSLSGAECLWGTFAITTPMVYSKNMAYDVRELEYEAFGWNEFAGGGIYRQSRLNGLVLGDFEYLAANTAALHDIKIIQYSLKSPSGWKEYTNSMSTFLAPLAGDADAVASVVAIIAQLVIATGVRAT